MAAFLEYHCSYRLKELVAHGGSAEHLFGMRRTGGWLWNGRTGRYRLFWEDDLNEIVSKPHIADLTREIALADPGSWIGSLFVYQPPRFSFNRSEQRLLLAALNGGTDQELCEDLEISLDTIKKTWRRIYGRVAACSPEVLVHGSAEDRLRTERGKEKKQRLILYLRDHPEELRPASRRLFQKTTSPARE